MKESNRLAKYTVKYFTERKIPEIQSWHDKIVRDDICAALCYALGYTREETRRLEKLSGTPYLQHWSKIFNGRKRTPNLVADVGAGRGEICALLSLGGISNVGIDPSPGAATLFPKTMTQWANKLNYLFYNLNSTDGLMRLMYLNMFPDTIIMCESIEHIRRDEFEATWVLIKQILTKTSGLFVVTNRLKFHPIAPDNTGYDHITRIDDSLYDRLSKESVGVLVREKSHLVLQF